MKSYRLPVIVAALAGSLMVAPGSARGQYTPDAKSVGFHVGMSGVGSAAALGVQGQMSYNEHVSFGGWFDTWSYGQSFAVLGSTTSWDIRYFAISGSGSYHFPIENNPKLDPFLGVSVGYYVVNSSASGPGGTVTYTGDGSRIFAGGHAGGRYFFKPNMSVLALVGIGASYLTLGMDFGL